jgi:hypothetical protein
MSVVYLVVLIFCCRFIVVYRYLFNRVKGALRARIFTTDRIKDSRPPPGCRRRR